MEFFSIHMYLSITAGTIKPIRREGEKTVSHLLFADDMLIFTKGDADSLKAVDAIMDLLATNSGLNINKQKSKIF